MKILLTTFNAKYIHKSLGLRWLYVARPNGFDVEIVEFTIKENVENCAKELMRKNPDVIGISVSIWNVEETKQLIEECKQINPLVRILLGGPEVTYENEEWFKLPIEAIIQGEGEQVFWDYLIEEKIPFGVKTNPTLKTGYAKADITWLETLESPYLLKEDLKEMSSRYLYVETSRGCPYRCSYCLSSVENQVRFFSLPYLSELFSELEQYPIPQVKFLDRTYNIDHSRAMTIANQLVKNPQRTTYQFEIVADTLTDQYLTYMIQEEWVKRFRYEVGIQSFYQPTLKEIGRTQNNQRLKEVMNLLLSNGVVLHADLIAGLPLEDYLQFQNSFEQLVELNPPELQLGILKLLKGTKMRFNVEQYGMKFNLKVPYTVKKTNWLTEEELILIEGVADAVERTYNNHRLRYTISELLERKVFINAFQLFLVIAEAIETLSRPYQIKELFLAVERQLIKYVPLDVLQKIMIIDYYYQVKQRPTTLYETISKEEKRELQNLLLERNLLSEEELFHYTSIEKAYYNKKDIYLIVVYQKNQSYAKQYCFDRMNNQWEKRG